jgi:hypothetical protein
VRRRREVVPLGAGELADDDAAHVLELAELVEIEERAVDLDRRAARVLEEEDRAVEDPAPTDVPIVKMKSRRQPPTMRPLALPPAIETTVSRSLSSGTGPVVSPPSTLKETLGCEGGGDGCPSIVRLGPVERREPGAGKERRVQRRDVESPMNAFGVSLIASKSRQRNRLRGAVAAAHRLDGVDLGIREGRLQVGGARTRGCPPCQSSRSSAPGMSFTR